MLKARRFEHWLGQVSPIVGPAGMLWLRVDRSERLVALDRMTGSRLVDQPGRDGAYVVVDSEVFPRANAPSEALPPLPKGFRKDSLFRRRVGGDVWIHDTPSRGAVKQRSARLPERATAFEATMELPFASSDVAACGALLFVRNGAEEVIHVHRASETVASIPAPSPDWFHICARDDVFAFCTQGRDDHGNLAIVSVGYAREPAALRSFALRSRGAVYVTMTPDDLVVAQYTDVLLFARAQFADAPLGDQAFVIDDVPTPSPPPDRIAHVTVVGASTGISFAVGADGVRKRLATQTGPGLVVGEVIAVEEEDAQVITAWRRALGSASTLAASKRCLEPMEITTARAAVRPRVATPAQMPPRGEFCTSVVYETDLTDPDSDETLDDSEALRSLDGQLELGGDVSDFLLDDEIDIALISIWPVLRFDETEGRLRFVFEFNTNAQPDARNVQQMFAIAERLMEGGWGANYAFDAPEDYQGYVVHIGERVSSGRGAP